MARRSFGTVEAPSLYHPIMAKVTSYQEEQSKLRLAINLEFVGKWNLSAVVGAGSCQRICDTASFYQLGTGHVGSRFSSISLLG